MGSDITISTLPDSYSLPTAEQLHGSDFQNILLAALDPTPDLTLSRSDKRTIRAKLREMDRKAYGTKDGVVTLDEAKAFWPDEIKRLQSHLEATQNPVGDSPYTFTDEQDAERDLARARAVGAVLNRIGVYTRI